MKSAHPARAHGEAIAIAITICREYGFDLLARDTLRGEGFSNARTAQLMKLAKERLASEVEIAKTQSDKVRTERIKNFDRLKNLTPPTGVDEEEWALFGDTADIYQVRGSVIDVPPETNTKTTIGSRYQRITGFKHLDLKTWLECGAKPFPVPDDRLSTELFQVLSSIDDVIGLPFFVQAETMRLRASLNCDDVEDLAGDILDPEQNEFLEKAICNQDDLDYMVAFISHALSSDAIKSFTNEEWFATISPSMLGVGAKTLLEGGNALEEGDLSKISSQSPSVLDGFFRLGVIQRICIQQIIFRNL